MSGYSYYIFFWVTCTSCAVIAVIVWRKRIGFATQYYLRYLTVRWKWVTFIVAGSGITLVAPYTDDPTWSYTNAFVMSLLTFISAPWSVGTLARALYGRASLIQVYVASCFWLFSASWSYDGYLLIRDGIYPMTWFDNLLLSSTLYLAAGLLWNLEWTHNAGVKFAFQNPDWPVPVLGRQLHHILWCALPFMVFAIALITAFLKQA